MKKMFWTPLWLLLLIACAALLCARSTVQAEGGGMPNSEWSPDGTRIAFVWLSADDNLEAEVYVVDADGSHLRNVTNTPEIGDFTFVWLADNQHLLIPIRQQSYGIAATETGDLVQPPGLTRWYDVSADRTHIAYNSTETRDLIVLNGDGSLAAIFTNAPPLSTENNLFWSGDGQQILYWSTPSKDNEVQCPLMLADADGSGTRVLIEAYQCFYFQPAMSPDGLYAAMSLYVDADTQNLFVFDLVEGGYVNLYQQFGVGAYTWDSAAFIHPVWSPEGRYLTFQDSIERIPTNTYLYDPRQQRLRDFGELPDGFQNPEGTWSPDGRYFLINHQADFPSLYLFDTQTQSFSRLIGSGDYASLQGAWSPDSSELLVVGNQGNSAIPDDLLLLSRDGTVIRQIVPPYPDVGSCTWSADGEFFLFFNQNSENGYWLVGDSLTGATYAASDQSAYRFWDYEWSPTGHQLALLGIEGLSLYDIDHTTGVEQLWLTDPHSLAED